MARPGDPHWDDTRTIAEGIEAAVFDHSFGETAEVLRGYYDEHLPQTAFVIAREHEWAGMMRLGLPGPRTSLSLDDAERPPFEVDVLAELGADGTTVVPLDVLTTAVVPRYRARGTFERMLVAAVDLAVECSCTHLVAMLDHHVLSSLRLRKVPGRLHSGRHPYYGSAATVMTSTAVADLRAWLEYAGAGS